MSYNGYLLKAKELILPYVEGSNVFQNGSYKFTKEPRINNEWKDITGKIHRESTKTERVIISFTIKERDASCQAKIKELFSQNENISVEYYDGFDDTYKQGLFFMKNKEEIVGIATSDNVYYKPIDIILEEY